MEANGFPSRTSILTAAARAFGAREPDASVRNPDWLAERLIGPSELALISDHPISQALDREFQEAIYDPAVFGFVWLMLVRTRFIDELMERAVRNGAAQLVILGAGFDTRAHRFAELLKDAAVFEIDYGATQEYKKRRVQAALGAPANLVYAPIDFTRESLGDVLRRAGFLSSRPTYYICDHGQDANGYAALAVWDSIENGGNDDGLISDSDNAVQLGIQPGGIALWIDFNHDGIAQPRELFTFDQLGVVSIDVRKYRPSHWKNKYGNHFRYTAPVTLASGANAASFDVFFVIGDARPNF